MNPLNRHAKGIGKTRMLALFPQAKARHIRRIGLLPPLAGLLDRCCPPLVTGLERLRLLNTYYLAVLQKMT